MSSPTSWKALCAAALTESDVQRLPQRIQQARDAIMERVEQLMEDPHRKPEHDEILSALNRLDALATQSQRRHSQEAGMRNWVSAT